MKKAILFLVGMFLMVSCVNNKSTESVTSLKEIQPEQLSEGFRLLENSCFSCHNPNPTLGNKIAPSFAEIKKNYIGKNSTQNQFEENVIQFVNNPIKENSKIKGAIDKYGSMPKLSFSTKQLKAIAYYIYNTNIESVDWYKNQYKKEKLKLKNTKIVLSPIQQGKEIVMKTKGVLGKNLLGAIKSKGTKAALEFCNEKAVFLVDSMAVKLNAKIKRVSDKNRNPNNRASGAELEYILNAKQGLKNGIKPKPKLINIDGKQIKYYPIMTNKMCMQCHGKPKVDIKIATQKAIDLLYPNDNAFGYKENELRGIWVIETDK